MPDEPHARILVVDDEKSICINCVRILSAIEYETDYALTGMDAMRMISENPYDIVITDLKMNRMSGMEVLARIRKDFPETVVIVMTGYASVSSAVEVMKIGAHNYLPKPFTPNELRAVVAQAAKERELIRQNRRLMGGPGHASSPSHQLIGESPAIKKVISMIGKVAKTNATVLICGESGTGKELVARAVHANSLRKDKVFFAVDCGTLSGNLLESELFGFRKGAFTSAHKDKEGIFTAATNGTVFLDEISNISHEVQGKLLRFLDTQEFLPVGDIRHQKVDIRLIFATNKDLADMVSAGKFREDFFYRIFVYPIFLPPLRERKSDILPIAYHFLTLFNKRIGKSITGFEIIAAASLTAHEWPGNVRQLRNIIERAVILCETEQISADDLPGLSEMEEIERLIDYVPETNDELISIKKELRQKAVCRVEKNFIVNILEKNGWNVTAAARAAGLKRTNLQAMMKKHEIRLPGR